MTGGKDMLGFLGNLNEKVVNIAIIVVAVMLVVCLVLLIFVLGGKNSIPSSANNVIGTKGDDIKLSNEGDAEKIRFSVDNMFPGDSETKTFKVTVTNKKIHTICFKADIASENPALADVMHINVKLAGEKKSVYDGLIKDLSEGVEVGVLSGETNEFVITVTLDPSAGNECQNSEIAVNFTWWIGSLGYVQ